MRSLMSRRCAWSSSRIASRARGRCGPARCATRAAPRSSRGRCAPRAPRGRPGACARGGAAGAGASAMRLLGHAGLLDLGAVLVRLVAAAVGLAELRLDRAQLLAQEVLALAARHLVVRLRLDLRLHRGDVELAAQQRVDLAQPRQRVLDLEHLLGLGDAQLEVRGHEVGELTRLVDRERDREHLGRQILQRQQLLDPPAHGAHQRLGLDAPAARQLGVHAGDARAACSAPARRRPRRARGSGPAPAPSRGRRPCAARASPWRPCRRDAGPRDPGPRRRDRAAPPGSTRRSPASASSTAAIERGRATKSGSTMYGKTTISRSGRTGSSSGSATSAPLTSMSGVSTPRERDLRQASDRASGCAQRAAGERSSEHETRLDASWIYAGASTSLILYLHDLAVNDLEQVGALVRVAVGPHREHAGDAGVAGRVEHAVAHRIRAWCVGARAAPARGSPRRRPAPRTPRAPTRRSRGSAR